MRNGRCLVDCCCSPSAWQTACEEKEKSINFHLNIQPLIPKTIFVWCETWKKIYSPPSPVFIGADLWWTWVGWCLWLYFLGQWAGLSGLLVTAEKKVYFNIYTQQEQIDPWCKTVSVQTANHWHWAELKKRLKIWTATCVFVCLRVCLCWSGDEGRGLSAAWPDSSEETFLVILEAGHHKWQQLRV